jgi:acetyltransferase
VISVDEHRLLPEIGAITIRPLTDEDRVAYHRFCSQLSREDLRLRFGAAINIGAALCPRQLATDPAREAVFAAYCQEEDAILGVARLALVCPEEADIALIVRSDRKRRGLGRALLGRLVSHARARGLPALCGDVLYENYPAAQFAKAAGFVSVGPVGLMRHVRLALPLDDKGNNDVRTVA